MLAQVISTGEIIEVTPQTKITSAGNVTHYIEHVPSSSAPRYFQEYELRFSNFCLPNEKKDEPYFDVFDWQAFGRNMVKELFLANCSPDNPLLASRVKNIINAAKIVVDELKNTTF